MQVVSQCNMFCDPFVYALLLVSFFTFTCKSSAPFALCWYALFKHCYCKSCMLSTSVDS